MIEKRRYARTPINRPVTFILKEASAGVAGVAGVAGIGKDISLGGMFIQTDTPAPFNAEITVHVHLPGAAEAFALPAVVRWVGGGGIGVQFGMLGVKETHTITEIGRRFDEQNNG